jgi:hypothetical protein
MKALFALLILVAGCSYTFDSAEPSLPYLGDPPDTAALPTLNSGPVDNELFALAADQRVWILLQHTDSTWEMKPMSGDPDADTIDPVTEQMQLVAWRAMYLTRRESGSVDGGAPPDFAVAPRLPTDMGASAPATVKLIVRSVGEHPGHEFDVPDGPALLYSLGADDGFAYIVTNKALPGYLLQRRDGSFKRVVPWPKGIDPANPFKDGLFFRDYSAGAMFYDRDIDGRIVGHSTRDNRDVDLGIRPRFLAWAGANKLVTCGSDGVHVVPTDGHTPELVLDDDICKPALFAFGSAYVYYEVGTTLRKAKLDGSEAPITVFDFGGDRITFLSTADDVITYSTDPAERYIHGAGDGWLGGWKFMDRGLGVNFSDDRLHLYWREHAAQASGAGDLMTIKLPGPAQPGGTPVTLAKNTRQYVFLRDGRILADENHVNDGVWNRIVVIDEARGHKQYVAVGADHFSQIPQSSDYIVDVITGASGHNVVRVAVPPIP